MVHGCIAQTLTKYGFAPSMSDATPISSWTLYRGKIWSIAHTHPQPMQPFEHNPRRRSLKVGLREGAPYALVPDLAVFGDETVAPALQHQRAGERHLWL